MFNMKHNFFYDHSLKSVVRVLTLLISLSVTVSCAPVVYDVAMDVRSKSQYSIDLHGVPPSIISICERQSEGTYSLDSTLASKVAFGTAEKLEKDLSLKEGDIPVFTFYSDEMDVSDVDNVKYLLTNAGSDRVIVLDSMRVSAFNIQPAVPEEHSYEIVLTTDVKLPFSLKIKIFSIDSLLYGTSPLEKEFIVNQYIHWSLISNKPVEDKKAISTVMGSLSRAFKEMGEDVGAGFSPQWKEQSRMLFSYETGEWSRADLCASKFDWEKALKIWMGLADGKNAKKTAYAAYNAAVACEILEKFDLAMEWLGLARSYYDFDGISVEENNITKGRDNRIF